MTRDAAICRDWAPCTSPTQKECPSQVSTHIELSREVEEFLYRHPQVQDVQCVGIPDATYGEELCACIIPREGHQPTEQDIRDFCAGKIARFKIPRYIRFVTNFPMTVSGKVAKYLLREQIAGELHETAVA